MAKSHKWTLKARFRASAYGWKGTALASKRLKEAVSEIKKVAKKEPVVAAEGVVSLMERLWPALEHIDGSSGSLGNAVYRTLEMLLPILVDAPADVKTRGKWMDRLYEAILDDGVDYLAPVQERWGHLCVFPEVTAKWAEELLPVVRRAWSDDEAREWVAGVTICLSCLLELERFDELQQLTELRSYRFWHYDQFWAMALARQGRTDAALAVAETSLTEELNCPRHTVALFCEDLLLSAGREDEAYERFGLLAAEGTTNLSRFRHLTKKYAAKDALQILNDLIAASGRPGKWFAAAKDVGFLGLALECAENHEADPATLIRAARDFTESEPAFAARVAVCALRNLLAGGGYEPAPLEVMQAHRHLKNASERAGMKDWARAEVGRLLEGSCGRELLREALEREHARQ